MALTKVQFKPGIDREGTQYSAGPTWYDCDKVRFNQNRPETIGGWVKYVQASYKGVARSLLDWASSASSKYLGIGTNLKFYVEYGGSINDITPIRETTAAGAVTFAAVNGSSIITVTDNAHGAVMGDFVTYSGAVSLGGVITGTILNKEYEIGEIVSANSYKFTALDANGSPIAANASDTGNGGAAVVGAYQINTGTNAYVPSIGYGIGTYGGVPWGGGGALTFANQLRLYNQDVFGDDLIFNPRAGGVYYWDESSGVGVRGVALSSMGGASNAPINALQVMVSPIDRHVICFGVNPIGSSTIDPLLVRWSTQENAVDWTPTATNTSGGQVLATGTSIVGAIKTRQEILIFTDTSVHSMRFVGDPYVYQFSIVAENVSMISPLAGVSIGDAVFFMDDDGFYVYRGSVEKLNCTVLEYVFSAIDETQLYKVFATNSPDHSEVTWFYPTGSNGAEINRYVTFNYAAQAWTIGTLARGAWIHAMTRANPIASSADVVNVRTNYLYNHESGYDADGEALAPYIESGELSLTENGDGESFMFMDRLIPDFKIHGTENNTNVTVSVKGTDFPMDAPTTLATANVGPTTQQCHVRARAREVILRIDGAGTGYGWTMGDFRFDLRPDGRR